VIDASHGGALSGNQTFSNAFGGIDSNAIVRGYVNGPALISALSSSPSLAALPPSTRSYLISAVGTGKFRGSAAFGLTIKPKTITFAIHSTTHGKASGAPADVSGLPEQSWLALATGSFNVAQLQSLLSATPQSATALNLFRQRFGIDVAHDVLPALGPIQLAIQGNALPALQAGLSITPSNLAAAGRVLAVLYDRAKHSPKLSVRGTPTSFVITKPGQPLPNATVAQVGRRVLATFDETFSQFTSPSSTLSSNPVFLRAKSALSGASHISVFVDFATLASFASEVPNTGAKAQQVLGRLDYFVLGSSPGQGDVRFVLGLR
jgi:hypothetical protein